MHYTVQHELLAKGLGTRTSGHIMARATSNYKIYLGYSVQRSSVRQNLWVIVYYLAVLVRINLCQESLGRKYYLCITIREV